MAFLLNGEALPLLVHLELRNSSERYSGVTCEAIPGLTPPPGKCCVALSLLLQLVGAITLHPGSLTIARVLQGPPCILVFVPSMQSTYLTVSHQLFAEWKEERTTLLGQILLDNF